MVCLNDTQLAERSPEFAAAFRAAAKGGCMTDRQYVTLRRALRGSFGLGDAVAAVAQPIARAVDAVAGTNLRGCGGCKKRRADWNAAIPDLLHPFK